MPLVRRAVDVDDQRHARLPGHGERSAVLPEVLADRQPDVGAEQPHRDELVAGLEVPLFVEYAVVGQVVLEVGRGHLPVDQQRGGVARPRRFVDESDDHGRRAEPGLGQLDGQRQERRAARGAERRPQDEVLRRVAGEHQFGERHQRRA